MGGFWAVLQLCCELAIVCNKSNAAGGAASRVLRVLTRLVPRQQPRARTFALCAARVATRQLACSSRCQRALQLAHVLLQLSVLQDEPARCTNPVGSDTPKLLRRSLVQHRSWSHPPSLPVVRHIGCSATLAIGLRWHLFTQHMSKQPSLVMLSMPYTPSTQPRRCCKRHSSGCLPAGDRC